MRYLHSDIDTVERVEIIRDLRLGKFDVLVGINLLREGLDMPEVSLVAILDADKEGFLRSERLADPDHRPRGAQPERQGDPVRRPDDRLDAARDRRDRSPPQQADRVQRGARHHAASASARTCTDIMEGARADTTDFGYKMGKKKRGAEEAAPNLRMLSPEQIVREIKRLEAEMYKHARNLEFEEAARLRDAIEKMKQQELGLERSEHARRLTESTSSAPLANGECPHLVSRSAGNYALTGNSSHFGASNPLSHGFPQNRHAESPPILFGPEAAWRKGSKSAFGRITPTS